MEESDWSTVTLLKIKQLLLRLMEAGRKKSEAELQTVK